MDVGQYTDVQQCISKNIKGSITILQRRTPIALEETFEEDIRDKRNHKRKPVILEFTVGHRSETRRKN